MDHRPATRLPSLTSLRWFAASAVFLIHSEVLVAHTGIAPLYSHIAPQGATGVSFFFILSGFVLAWAYRPGDTSRGFYRRRVARIVPIYLVVTAVAFAYDVTVAHTSGTGPVFKAIFPVTLLQSWCPTPSVYSGNNGPSWSLSTEVFFYALFPLLIVPVMRLDRRRLAWLLGACLVAAIAVPLLVRPHDIYSVAFWAVYVNPLYRVFEFAIGLCLCALLRGGVRLRIPPLAAAALAVGAYLLAAEVPLYAARVATTVIPFAVLLFAFAEADLEGRGTFVDRPWLIRLGQWSFAFFLVHWLVIRALALAGAHHPSTAWRAGLLAAAYLGSIAVAYLLFRFVEYPLERRIRRGGSSTPPAEARPSAGALDVGAQHSLAG